LVDSVIKYSLMEVVYAGPRVLCSDHKCGRYVSSGESCFFDLLVVSDGRPDIYCDSCGKMVRHSRRKKEQRERQHSRSQGE
jgi:hypothetical protein